LGHQRLLFQSVLLALQQSKPHQLGLLAPMTPPHQLALLALQQSKLHRWSPWDLLDPLGQQQSKPPPLALLAPMTQQYR